MKHNFRTIFGGKLGLPSMTIHPLAGRCFLVREESADAIVAKFKESESARTELLAAIEKCEAALLEAQRYFGTTCVLPLATEMIPEALAAIRAVKGEKL